MHLSLSLCVCCVCVCENATENGLNLIRFFTSKDQCLKLQKGDFLEAFYPTHPRSLSVFILIKFRLWWYGCELVVVFGWR